MKEPTTAWTKAYLPKEIRDKEKFLLWVKVKKRLLYCGKILNYLLLIGVGLLFVYPFAWMFSMSLRPLIEALSFDPNLWVSDPQWSNYIYAWNQAQLSHYVGNSVKYSILVIGLQCFTIIPAAYGFAMMEFRGKKFLWSTKFLGMMLPAEATLIPVYFFYSKMGLVDNWFGLILPSLEMSRNVQSGNTQNLKSSAVSVRLPAAPAPTPVTSQAAAPAGCAYRL